MTILAAALVVALAIGKATTPPVPADHAFAEAATAAENLDFDRARELYEVAASGDPDPRQRDIAAIRLANIEWRVQHDEAAAQASLAMVRTDGDQIANAWTERARIASELRVDFEAARESAERAIASATSSLDRSAAVYAHAWATIEPIRRAHLAGRCEGDHAMLETAERELQSVVSKVGPIPRLARLLVDAALLMDDGSAALDAWRGYYGPTAQSALLKPVAATLDAQLPGWRGADSSPEQRRAVGLALADSRLFTEAALVLRDPCARQSLDLNEARIADVLAYEAVTRALQTQVDEYYRQVALHRADKKTLEGIVDSADRSLWTQLSWSKKPPAFSSTALLDQLGRKFGTVATLGNTSNIFDLHLGHRVIDEERQVSQYGRTASLRFVSLDGIISNGFSTWIYDGRGGDGGWTNQAIYQVRPAYAPGPLITWLKATEPQLREQRDREIADETSRDEQRIAADPRQMPLGVTLRLERQYQQHVLDKLRASALSEDRLRDAFIARITQDTFESSIWAHEGRHAIDKKYDKLSNSAELEFRAKLSEVAFAPAPRRAAEAIGAQVPATSPHGVADRRIGEGLSRWMREHAAAISGIDASKPMLLQVDKLSDEQLRDAFRSLDPLARSAP